MPESTEKEPCASTRINSGFADNSGETKFYRGGLNFFCSRCSACCRFESGFVFLSEKDTSLLCAVLNMPFKEFSETYCRWIPAENGSERLSLKEKSNNDCVFWSSGTNLADEEAASKGGCGVYGARPLQCRAFPFWPSILGSDYNWKMAACDCPGMNKGILHSGDCIEEWLALQKNEPVISRKRLTID